MSENFTWREQLKTNFKINLSFSILWANPQGVTRAQMSQISGDGIEFTTGSQVKYALKVVTTTNIIFEVSTQCQNNVIVLVG